LGRLQKADKGLAYSQEKISMARFPPLLPFSVLSWYLPMRQPQGFFPYEKILPKKIRLLRVCLFVRPLAESGHTGGGRLYGNGKAGSVKGSSGKA
jgi:hypothetical protein